mgnify:FL=1|jgi:hypothetical protein|tara:strand:+ start:236 stop:631 length:396 start_codon:yes stop_codon:yes gene_type:complete
MKHVNLFEDFLNERVQRRLEKEDLPLINGLLAVLYTEYGDEDVIDYWGLTQNDYNKAVELSQEKIKSKNLPNSVAVPSLINVVSGGKYYFNDDTGDFVNVRLDVIVKGAEKMTNKEFLDKLVKLKIIKLEV